MPLTKRFVGELIRPVDERNSIGIKTFYGININKEFMPTFANTEGLDERKYKVVRKNRFVFSGMQTGRDQCIRISMFTGEDPVIVSPAYITFEISAVEAIRPMYFFMLFLSKEKDRLGAFYSDGSIRSNLEWDRFCEIELQLPSLEIQDKYINIYRSILSNQQSYERGLDDLKLVCDGFIDSLSKRYHSKTIGRYLGLVEETNETEKLGSENVRGITTQKTFIPTKANMLGVSLRNYKLVPPHSFAYVADTSRRGDKVSLAYNNSEVTFLVSSITTVFKVTDEASISADYLSLYFNRQEFDRYARFCSWGSAREVFSWEEMCDVRIPLPDINIQRSIANVFKVYNERKRINESLKKLLLTICPVLIKGSIDEARRS